MCAVAVVRHRVARVELDPGREGADHPVRLARHGEGVTQGVMGRGAELVLCDGRLGRRQKLSDGLFGGSRSNRPKAPSSGPERDRRTRSRSVFGPVRTKFPHWHGTVQCD